MAITTEEAFDELKPLFEMDEQVLSFHGPLLYDAKILRRKKYSQNDPTLKAKYKHTISNFGTFVYLLHFNGWGKRYDEWTPELLIMKFTLENVKIQNDLRMGITSEMSSNKQAKKPTKTANSSSLKSKNVVQNVKTDEPDNNGVIHLDHDITGDRSWRQLKLCTESTEKFLGAPQVQIPFPDRLKQVLFDDWVLIVQKNKLLNLPSHASVETILEEYFVARGDTQGSPEDKFTSNIETSFNSEIQSLIYAPEKLQFEFVEKCKKDIVEEMPEDEEIPEFASVYGIVHLLRLISKTGANVAHSNFDSNDVECMLFYMADFLKFLEENVERYFDPKLYTLTVADYQTVLGLLDTESIGDSENDVTMFSENEDSESSNNETKLETKSHNNSVKVEADNKCDDGVLMPTSMETSIGDVEVDAVHEFGFVEELHTEIETVGDVDNKIKCETVTSNRIRIENVRRLVSENKEVKNENESLVKSENMNFVKQVKLLDSSRNVTKSEDVKMKEFITNYNTSKARQVKHAILIPYLGENKIPGGSRNVSENGNGERGIVQNAKFDHLETDGGRLNRSFSSFNGNTSSRRKYSRKSH